ncbi:MAG TPA: bifunctional methylenetetrahydrofolate dehydrogenase/methenyltetrahydrofolate cyclohydrolase FolD [bacterium]|jgi:methylenetetrahydrofolate dehydrogenase (NADP+)/methenyltetrahydrofolate cyclohydrolase|nr:bifunctional methylenetetrahydrofolate dehydrogenase/methenyltetrahydrofolate cyclohydrolase FolD [bacterium]
MPLILDGNVAAKAVQELLVKNLADLKSNGQKPGLAVVLVGDDPASAIYVGRKKKACDSLGFYSEEHRLSKETSETELLELIRSLNANSKIHGVLVQLPLPKHLNTQKVIETIDPRKDVDGMHPYSLGKLVAGLPGLRSCTPAGVMAMLDHYKIPVSGKRAVVIGRSIMVGKPMAQLLIEANATVTVCHSQTRNIATVIKEAELLVAAIGKPRFVTSNMVREGAVVVDVGINRTPEGKLVGDVDFEAVSSNVSAITPVPGGVGPMTIALLMKNTYQAFLQLSVI